MPPETLAPSESKAFIAKLEAAFKQSNTEFARAYYLFATAKLVDNYSSEAIYNNYPLLTEASTFEQLKPLYDANPTDDTLRRLYKSVLDTYVDNQLSQLSDAYENAKSQLKVDLSSINVTNPDGTPAGEVLYEDLSEWLKRLPEKNQRDTIYEKLKTAFETHLAPLFMEAFTKNRSLMADLGYGDTIGFYSQMLGHPLKQLGNVAESLLKDTQALYQAKVEPYYQQRTGLDFTQATRSDISYVFHGPGPSDSEIEALFKADRLLSIAESTFNRLGFDFSTIAAPVDFESLEAHQSKVSKPSSQRIYLDVAHRVGKRSRAYVYPAKVPNEIYLSVKPEGGLDDYLAFFHESGHALHFAYGSQSLSYTKALMGNNTTTEAFAYLFQNLLLNEHWLTHQVGLSPEQAKQVVNRGALNDLYMLRRYSAKLSFELALFADNAFEGKGDIYAEKLTQATGFAYDAEGWRRDVDAGFYVADYFTAWTLEAQLRTALASQFGSSESGGLDWYANPQAGTFLKELWALGNINHDDLAQRLADSSPGHSALSGDANDTKALLDWMKRNLE